MTHATAVTPLVAHLRRLAPDVAAAARLVHDRRLLPLWQQVDDDIAIEPVAAPHDSACYLLQLACDAGPFALAFATADDDAFALAAADDLSRPLRALAAAALFDGTAARLRAAGLEGLEARALSRLAAKDAPRHGWCALQRDGIELGRVALPALPGALLDRLRGFATPVAGTMLRARLAVPASIAVARRSVSLAALRSLAAGDVLLLPPTPAGLEGAAARLHLGPRAARHLAIAGRIRRDSFIAEGEPQMTDDHDEAPEAADAADALGELELPVHFEIETLSVPLADLESIAPGYVIELAMPAAEARLRLVSCGQVIGHAELVAVGERLGARITRMVARDDAQLDA
jgi:type III secretion protein Q